MTKGCVCVWVAGARGGEGGGEGQGGTRGKEEGCEMSALEKSWNNSGL